MNPTQSAPSGESKQIANVVIHQANEKRVERPVATATAAVAAKVRGYGLPCAKCKTYYAADLDACPICQSAVRVKPSSVAVAVSPAAPIPELAEETPIRMSWSTNEKSSFANSSLRCMRHTRRSMSRRVSAAAGRKIIRENSNLRRSARAAMRGCRNASISWKPLFTWN